MYDETKQLEVPVVGNTYISRNPDNKYSKVTVLEHNEEVYKLAGGESPLSLVIFKVLEPLEAKDNIDIEVSESFYDTYIRDSENTNITE